MQYYHRENYLKRIRGFYHDTGMIKVITGVRRCGKSCLMATIMEELLASGVPEERVIYLDLDRKDYEDVTRPEQLRDIIDGLAGPAEKSSRSDGGIFYLFIDEIQNVRDYEKVINAYREEGNYSIFLTGSNSYLLSGELVTKLTGRYLEFELYPLSFDEYLGMKKFLGKSVSSDYTAEFDRYIREGGFPKTLEYDDPDDKETYVRGIIREIFQKDIRRRVRIRNTAAFQTVQQYVINNFGSTTSLTNILKDLEKAGCSLKRETVNRYLRILMDAKILHRCERFDLKSRRSIQGEAKYYLADLGFYFATNTDNRINYGPVLENIIYIYARAKGYEVSVGRIGKLECDFILRHHQNEYAYVQAAMTIMGSRETEDREYRPLEKIPDNYPKYVMTRNDPIQKRNGIRHVNIGPFMGTGQMF